MKTVGEVAAVTGVTVRTLHHYDEVGLLVPGGRSDAGYRLYSYDDLERLQEILVWRALGFSLTEIRSMPDDPAYDRMSALVRQRELIDGELERLGALRGALDAALEAQRNGTRLTEATMFEGFDPAEYEEEARERWGDTEAYRESTKRAASYGEEEWSAIKDEANDIMRAFASVYDAGEPADSDAARAVAERHRQHISRWFYGCPPEMHRGLGRMLASDERFARNYEQLSPGLAAYVRDAMAANASELGAPTP